MKSEKNIRKELSKLIKELPRHKAPADLWEKIEPILFLEENFGHEIKKLPVHKTPEKTWENIEIKLKAEATSTNYKGNFRAMGIAASLLIVTVFCIQMYKNYYQQKTDVTTYEESIIMYKPTEPEDLTTQEAMTIIEDYCTRQFTKCESAEFEQLLSELNDLAHEIKQLEAMYPTYIDSDENPELVKMKIKIENTHAEVLKAIMTIIQS